MPESVKDLTIRLAFEHGDTKSQVAAIRNEIKALETDFAASAAAAGGFSAGLTESAARSKMLEQQIELQRQAVEKYGKAIDSEKAKIESAQKRQQEYNQKLNEAKTRHADLTAQKQKLAEAMKAEKKANGDNTMAYLEMDAAMDQLNADLKECETAMKGWETGVSRADRQIVTAEKNVQKYTIAQNEAKAAIGTMEKALTEQQRRVKAHADQLEAAEKKLRAFSDTANKTGDAQLKVGRTLSVASAGIAFAATTAAQAAIEWEDSFAGVRKTVSGTEEQLRSIEDALLDMEVPTDYTVLADIAANAGQLGIATDNVASFTRTMADLAETTNLTADEGASEFAKFANVVGMAQQDFDRLGSTVVQLGNNMATTEADIMSMASRLASAGSQAGMSEADIMGVAAGLSSLGLEAQAGGTAFSKLLIDMKVAAETGSERLDELARVAGMTGTQFKTAFEQDAAAAVTQFIQGLSTGSESAIVMLDELGIKETRFRDTLLRTSNASGLFADAIQMANSAWEENTALANEAEVRYKTTASRMKMLGKEAQKTAMTFGQSVLPYLETGMEKIGELIDKFNGLDKAQRDGIVRWGLYAASIGPGVSMLGKANKALGSAGGALAKFAKTLADGAGGAGGLMKALGGLLGPAGVLAVAGALIYGTYKLYDWASGAKAAREATEALNAAAKDWINTQAKTIYDTGNSDPLGLFGLSRDDFAGASKEARDWFNELVTVWTDGEKETGEIVKQFTDSFAAGSEGVREAIEAQKGTLDEYDALTPEAKAQMDADLKQLDDWDKEVAALLKKRQNGYLTDEETARLNEIINARGQLAIQYSVEKGDGYQQIITQMQADVERAAHGGHLDSDYFGNVLNALAEGRAAYNDALDETYRAEYANIQAIKDEEARTKALDELNTRYQARRQEGEDAYNQSVLEAGKTTWENGNYQAQIEQIDKLVAALGDADGVDIPAVKDLADGLDEGALTSMIALVEQLKAAGASDEDLKQLGIDYESLMTKITAIRDAAKDTAGLEGLADMFGTALPQEIQRIMVGLDMTQAAADWEEFARGGNLDAIKARVEPEEETIDLTGGIKKVLVAEGVTFEVDGSGRIRKLKTQDGVTFEVDGDGKVKRIETDDGVTFEADGDGKVKKIETDDGLTFETDGEGNITRLITPDGEEIDLTGNVKDIDWPEGSEFIVDADGNITHVRTPDGLTFEVDADGNITHVRTPDGLTFEVDGDGNITGVETASGVTFAVDGDGRITEVTTSDGLSYTLDGEGRIKAITTADGLTFEVDGDGNIKRVTTAEGVTFEADGEGKITRVITPEGQVIDLTGNVKDIDWPEGSEFIVDADGNITHVRTPDGVTFEVDGDGNITGVQTAPGVSFAVDGDGVVTELTLGPGAKMPTLTARASVMLNSLDKKALALWKRKNRGVTLQGPAAKVNVALGDNWEKDINAALEAGTLRISDANGVDLPVTPETVKKISANDIVVMDEDGTLHVIITPELGTTEAVDNSTEHLNSTPVDNTILAPLATSTAKQLAIIQSYQQELAALRKEMDALKESGQGFTDEGMTLPELDTAQQNSLSALVNELNALDDTDLTNLADQAATLMAALQSGNLDEATAADYAAQLQAIVDTVTAADQYMGSGNNISEGIAKGMTEYGFDTDAATLAETLTGAINDALGAHSPATTLIPTGSDVSEGIAKGMTDFQFATACAAVSASIRAGFGSIGAQGQSAGEQFTAGLRRGLTGQLGGVVAEAKAAADQIAAAFRNAWQIHSPSRVAENLTRMFGAGLEKGMDKWPTVSQRMLENDLAMAYGTSSRAADAIRQTTNNNNDSVNLNIAELRVNDRQDAEALAYEIASLKRRTDRGRGLK